MKASPHQLRPKRKGVVRKTFSDWTDGRFRCSCGHVFDGNEPECPLDQDESGSPKHLVTEQQPALSFDITFKKIGRMDAMAAVSDINEAVQKYVTGYGDPKKKDYIPPIFLPPVADEIVTVSESAIQVACILCKAQVMPEGEHYTLEELLCFMVSDSICEQMCQTAIDIQESGGDGFADPLAPSTPVLSGTP